MTKVGFVGIGNLGYPLALTMAWVGHDVKAYDINMEQLNRRVHPVNEAGYRGIPFSEIMKCERLTYGSLEQVCHHAEIIFICVPTPHKPEFDGKRVLPDASWREDFDYTALSRAIDEVLDACATTLPAKRQDVVVVSTVLPGTTRRILTTRHHDRHKRIPDNVTVLYSPSLCAMGSTIKDFLEPELYMIGQPDDQPESQIAAQRLTTFYNSLTRFAFEFKGDGQHEHLRAMLQTPEKLRMWYESAELAKVAYNTFISAKLGVVNMLAEMCDKLPGADIDDVSTALERANKRVSSSAYMRAGMGDGGACHPRDNIAMSWLARELNLGYNLFEAVMQAREAHADYLATTLAHYATKGDPTNICLLGVAYKPGTNLTAGSHSLLVGDLLMAEILPNTPRGDEVKILHFDPYVYEHQRHDEWPQFMEKHKIGVVLVGCLHEEFVNYRFGDGCYVLDPHRVFSFGVQATPGHLLSFGIGPKTRT